MGCFATGVTIVSASVGDDTRAMTVNAFMSGSLDPLLCVVSVAKRSNMHAHLERARAFAVNVLSSAQLPLASHFGGRPDPVVHAIFEFVGEVPTLPDAIACITARTTATHPCGDHTLFVGEILSMRAGDGAPLLFHRGRYASLVPDRQDRLAPDLS
jgi:flavin reductase (DIM6/NTAB) family NADH-FMN oxidoreductase RutF